MHIDGTGCGTLDRLPRVALDGEATWEICVVGSTAARSLARGELHTYTVHPTQAPHGGQLAWPARSQVRALRGGIAPSPPHLQVVDLMVAGDFAAQASSLLRVCRAAEASCVTNCVTNGVPNGVYDGHGPWPLPVGAAVGA